MVNIYTSASSNSQLMYNIIKIIQIKMKVQSIKT